MRTGPEHTEEHPGGPVSDKLVRFSEIFVVSAAGLLVIAAIIISTAVLYALFIRGVRANVGSIDSIETVQVAVQRVFAGVLLLMLGLELLETLKTYFRHYAIRTEVILVVAIIAVGRHIIQFDLEHASGSVLAGMAVLIVGLAVSYYLVRARPPRSVDSGLAKKVLKEESDQQSNHDQAA